MSSVGFSSYSSKNCELHVLWTGDGNVHAHVLRRDSAGRMAWDRDLTPRVSMDPPPPCPYWADPALWTLYTTALELIQRYALRSAAGRLAAPGSPLGDDRGVRSPDGVPGQLPIPFKITSPEG